MRVLRHAIPALVLVAFAGEAQAQATVRRGDEGADVRRLQGYLISLDVLQGKADGKFGASTESAVITFQKSHGLKADGVAGPTTWTKLNVTKPAASAADMTTERKLLLTSPRMYGDDVKKAQELLRKHGHAVDSDGTYGTGTADAVKAFQRKTGLTPDGRIGPSTWTRLKQAS